MTGEVLTTYNGGVHGVSGLSGYVYAFSYGGATVSPENFEKAGEGVCIKGTAPDGGVVAVVWMLMGGLGKYFNADASGVVGFEFGMTGPALPTRIRVDAKKGMEDPYCKAYDLPGPVQYLFSDLRHNCYIDGGTQKVVPTSELDNISFWIDSPGSFDFCISPIAVLKE
jgi:hypothetical protein